MADPTVRQEVAEPSTAPGSTPMRRNRYDAWYRAGGFKYESRRPMHDAWVARNYVREFGLRRGQRILDIPCGDGSWSSILRAQGLAVVGVDLSEGGVEVARSRYPKVEFAVGDAEGELTYSRASFDVVFSRGISHLHRDDLFTDASRRMAANLMSYVRPGGMLLVSYFSRRDGGGLKPAGSDKVIMRYHLVSDLVRLFETAGDVFKVVVVDDFVQIGVQRRERPWRQRPSLRDRLRRLRAVGRMQLVRVRRPRSASKRD